MICHIITVQTQEPALDSSTPRSANAWQTSAKTQRQKHAARIPIEDTVVRHVATPQGDICDQHKEIDDDWLYLATN